MRAPWGKPVVAYTGGTSPHPWTAYVAHTVCAALFRETGKASNPGVGAGSRRSRLPVSEVNLGPIAGGQNDRLPTVVGPPAGEVAASRGVR